MKKQMDGYTTRRCLSCRASEDDVSLYPVFDGILYCEPCLEKYGLEKPEVTVYQGWEVILTKMLRG